MEVPGELYDGFGNFGVSENFELAFGSHETCLTLRQSYIARHFAGRVYFFSFIFEDWLKEPTFFTFGLQERFTEIFDSKAIKKILDLIQLLVSSE